MILTTIGSPNWTNEIVDNPQDHINVTCSCYNTMTDMIFLLHISWPNITNPEQMDFDSYKVLVETVGKQDDLVGETTATFYENMLRVQETQDFNLRVQITITAINKCNKTSTLQVNNTLTKGIIIHEVCLSHFNDKTIN